MLITILHFKTLTDIQECNDNNGNCAHNCTNTEGSYFCTCKDGYEQQDDGHICKGNLFVSDIKKQLNYSYQCNS